MSNRRFSASSIPKDTRRADDGTGCLAMLELRLEATRRPAPRAQLTRTVRDEFEERGVNTRALFEAK